MSTLATPAPARVLVVDDTPAHLQLLRLALHRQYQVHTADSAEQALRWIEAYGPPDIILLDVIMPGMDGYALCERLKADGATRDVPVIFLTARGDASDEVRGFACGAVDYIIKPAPAAVVVARVGTHLELRRTQQLLAQANRELEGEVAILESGIRGLAVMGHALGKDTRLRLERTQRYVTTLWEALGRTAPHALPWDERTAQKMVKASILYDIGKLAIPVQILDKPGSLSAAERALMNTHAELGGQALQSVIDEVVAQSGAHLAVGDEYEGPLAFLAFARDMALYHHEHWDGSGYPLGMSGEAIPLCARLVAVADVYDALLSRRPHKAPWTRQAARDFIAGGAGSRFDPRVVDAFQSAESTMYETWLRYSEPGERE